MDGALDPHIPTNPEPPLLFPLTKPQIAPSIIADATPNGVSMVSPNSPRSDHPLPSTVLGPPRYPKHLRTHSNRKESQQSDSLLHIVPAAVDADQALPPINTPYQPVAHVVPQHLPHLHPSVQSFPLIEGYLAGPDLPHETYAETPAEIRQAQLDFLEAQSRKVAPRSKDLFRVGPPFWATVLHRPFYCEATDEQIVPEMTSRIDRGFELGELGNWIGYKRNYITLVLTFVFQGWSMERFLKNRYYYVDESEGAKVEIKYFALGIAVKCNDPEVNISLVQHTPKRDKGPKLATPRYCAVPGGDLPDHQLVTMSSNRTNGRKVALLKRMFNFDREEYYQLRAIDANRDTSILRNYPNGLLTKVARFERIQFTASIRVTKDRTALKFFTLSIQLLGITDDCDLLHDPIVLATSDSHPLLVRGRSPSKYDLEKTSGYRDPMNNMAHDSEL